MNSILEVNKLKKYYGSIKGIENVSFKLEEGLIYGFIGPNGAGKSTTIRTIMSLINKTSGDIYLFGEKIDKLNNNLKEKIGYLPSEVNLYSDMSVKELFNYHASFYKGDFTKRRRELVKRLKIDEKKKIEELSLGNLKKLGIVLALMHNPSLLILDEATSGLDPIIQKELHNILLEEKNRGVTILYSSHILSEVSSICDKVIFIKDGKIIKEDNIDNIKNNNYTYLTITSKDIKKIKKELNLKVIDETESTIKLVNEIDVNLLIKKLSNYKIDKLLIENISLEDLFERYYK